MSIFDVQDIYDLPINKETLELMGFVRNNSSFVDFYHFDLRYCKPLKGKPQLYFTCNDWVTVDLDKMNINLTRSVYSPINYGRIIEEVREIRNLKDIDNFIKEVKEYIRCNGYVIID